MNPWNTEKPTGGWMNPKAVKGNSKEHMKMGGLKGEAIHLFRIDTPEIHNYGPVILAINLKQRYQVWYHVIFYNWPRFLHVLSCNSLGSMFFGPRNALANVNQFVWSAYRSNRTLLYNVFEPLTVCIWGRAWWLINIKILNFRCPYPPHRPEHMFGKFLNMIIGTLILYSKYH